MCIIRLSPTLFHSHLDAILVAASAGDELRFATLQTIITELAPSMMLPGDHFFILFYNISLESGTDATWQRNLQISNLVSHSKEH